MEFVDIHCHVLCGVDDGAKTEEQMNEMIDIAYEENIRTICFTPHFKLYEFHHEESIASYNRHIQSSFEKAKEYAVQKYPDLTLFLGSEIMFHQDIGKTLGDAECHTLGDSRNVLVEFSPYVTSHEIESAVMGILRKGKIPVIAHVERYGVLISKPKLALEFRRLGAYLQVNARSILNYKFGRTAHFIKTLLKNHLADVIATDAHDTDLYAPRLTECYRFVSQKYGDEYARKIFCEKPLSLLK